MAIIKKPSTKPVTPMTDAAFDAFVSKAPDATLVPPVTTSKNVMKGKQAQLTIHMQPALLDELNAYAADNALGLSRNQIISAAVRAWLAAQSK